MTVNLSPIGGAGQQFFDNNGVVLSGGKIYTYAAGTTTPQATYTSSSGATPHANPIVLDSAGRVPGGEIWLSDGTLYKFVIETSLGVLLGTYDNIQGTNDFGSLIPSQFNTTGNGVTTAFTLASAPTSENTTNVYVGGVYQLKNTYSVAGSVLTFSEAPPLNSAIEIMFS